MGFSPGFPLNAATIKARKKALAAVIHPDKGGSEEAMKRLNTAADALLRSIGAQR